MWTYIPHSKYSLSAMTCFCVTINSARKELSVQIANFKTVPKPIINVFFFPDSRNYKEVGRDFVFAFLKSSSECINSISCQLFSSTLSALLREADKSNHTTTAPLTRAREAIKLGLNLMFNSRTVHKESYDSKE